LIRRRLAAADLAGRLRREQDLAEAPLGPKPDPRRLDLEIPVFGLLGIGAPGLGLAADLEHLVDGLGRGDRALGRLVFGELGQNGISSSWCAAAATRPARRRSPRGSAPCRAAGG
jgi:hypothetical protein